MQTCQPNLYPDLAAYVRKGASHAVPHTSYFIKTPPIDALNTPSTGSIGG